MNIIRILFFTGNNIVLFFAVYIDIGIGYVQFISCPLYNNNICAYSYIRVSEPEIFP